MVEPDERDKPTQDGSGPQRVGGSNGSRKSSSEVISGLGALAGVFALLASAPPGLVVLFFGVSLIFLGGFVPPLKGVAPYVGALVALIGFVLWIVGAGPGGDDSGGAGSASTATPTPTPTPAPTVTSTPTATASPTPTPTPASEYVDAAGLSVTEGGSDYEYGVTAEGADTGGPSVKVSVEDVTDAEPYTASKVYVLIGSTQCIFEHVKTARRMRVNRKGVSYMVRADEIDILSEFTLSVRRASPGAGKCWPSPQR